MGCIIKIILKLILFNLVLCSLIAIAQDPPTKISPSLIRVEPLTVEKVYLNDTNTEISEDGGSNLLFKDAVPGAGKLTALTTTS